MLDWRRDAVAAPARGRSSLPIAAIGLADLNGALAAGGARPWHRDVIALAKQREELRGIGFQSPAGLEAWILHRGAEILLMGCEPGELGAAGLRALVDELAGEPLFLSRAAPDEIDAGLLASLGFRPGAEHLVFSSQAKPA